MKQMELFEELTYIDDDLILEAHEVPTPRHFHLDLRRAAVLLAAVMTVLAMSVAAVASMTEDLDSKLQRIWERCIAQGYGGFFCMVDDYWVEMHEDILDDRDVPMALISLYALDRAEVRVFSEGQTMEIKLEAMVLMDDGQVKYRSRTVQGQDAVIATIDNLIAGEPGNIVHLRRTISLLGEDGWEEVTRRNNLLAGNFGFQIPNGTDIRFPDMKYLYDEENMTQETQPSVSTDAEAKVIVPDGSNVVIVIEKTTD